MRQEFVKNGCTNIKRYGREKEGTRRKDLYIAVTVYKMNNVKEISNCKVGFWFFRLKIGDTCQIYPHNKYR